jgi:hypothetical protein
MIGIVGWMDGYQKVEVEVAVNANKNQRSVKVMRSLAASPRGSRNFGQNVPSENPYLST